MRNLDEFIEGFKKLPRLLSDRDLIYFFPEFFKAPSALTRLRAKGKTPPYFIVDTRILYLKKDVISWVKSIYQNKEPATTTKRKRVGAGK